MRKYELATAAGGIDRYGDLILIIVYAISVGKNAKFFISGSQIQSKFIPEVETNTRTR